MFAVWRVLTATTGMYRTVFCSQDRALVQAMLDCASVIVGCARAILSCARTMLGCVRTMISCARAMLGCAWAILVTVVVELVVT